MDGGTDFTSTEVIVVAIVGFGSALLGAVTGVLGAWFLQSRSDRREAISALAAVLTEMVYNATACELVADDGTRMLHGLRTRMWEAHGPRLVHALPRELFIQLQVNQALVEFLDMKYASVAGADSMSPDERAGFLLWNHRADRLRELITSHSDERRWYKALWIWISDRRSFEEKREATRAEITNYAIGKVRAAGYPMNEEGEWIGEDTGPPSDGSGTIQDEDEEQRS